MISELNLLLEDYIEIKDIDNLKGLSIYQVKVNDILKLGEENYSQLLLPYRLTMDIFNLPEEVKTQLNIFDIFFIKEFNVEENYMQLLLNSLKFFFKKENIYILQDGEGHIYKSIVIDNTFILNENNFELLSDYILKINQKDKIKIEKEPVFEGENAEKKLAIWRKMTKGRTKTENENCLMFVDIIKLVKYGGLRYMSNEEIKSMTLYELYDTYRLLTSEKGFDYGLNCSLAGADIKEDQHPINTWVKIFKTDNKK